MTTNEPNRKSYLRGHGVAMLIAAALSCVGTVFAVLGIQHYSSTHGEEAARRRLEEALLGRWELTESTEVPVAAEGAREWVEFRNDGTLRARTFSTVTADGKLVSRTEQFRTIGYRVVDGGRIVWNPDRYRRMK